MGYKWDISMGIRTGTEKLTLEVSISDREQPLRKETAVRTGALDRVMTYH